jgi:hypothetical protein
MICYLLAVLLLPNVGGLKLRISFDILIEQVILMCSFGRTHDPVGYNDSGYLLDPQFHIVKKS